MPNDMYTLKALSIELSSQLIGGKVEKVNQPEKDELIFFIHKNTTKLLVVSVNPNAPRIHLTNERKDNPYVAPAFLMLLRKRLLGARIENFSLVGFDRIIKIDFKGRNEMADEVSNTLYIELLGRYSNIILCDDKGLIIEALRHIYPENSFRCILPKIQYELPPNQKLTPLDTQQIQQKLMQDDANPLIKRIITNVSGFAQSTARELCFRLGIDDENKQITEQQASQIATKIKELYNINNQPYYQPCYQFNQTSEDYFVYPYTHTKGQFTNTADINEAVKICCLERDRKTRLVTESKNVSTAIKNAIKKTEKALAIAMQKQMDCKDYEQTRILGELITNYIYLIKKGDAEIEVYNYYTNSNVKVKLDPMLNAGQNAQAYYKKYAKEKRTISITTTQIQELQSKLNYLNSLKTCLDLCYLPQEIEGIKKEAIAAGLIEEKIKKSDKNKKSTALPPKEYICNGFKIYRGRNNIDNEHITFGLANEKDIWLHVKDLHGCHLIIKAENRQIPNEVIQVAAEIAGYYSSGKQSYKVAVDYTFKKYVKKDPSGVKGAVFYTNQKTAFITPKPHTELEINK